MTPTTQIITYSLSSKISDPLYLDMNVSALICSVETLVQILAKVN
jgi:hypothetical protein